MDRAHEMYEGREMHTGVWWGNLKKRDHLEDLGLKVRILLKRFLNSMDIHGQS
jgi:hypothetical protein